MCADAFDHFFVASLGGGDDDYLPAAGRGQADGERGLPAARATDQERVRHQNSIPRIAEIPSSNACFSLTISVTVSATSRSSSGASRPVAMTLTSWGRDRMASTTSAVSIQPQFIG